MSSELWKQAKQALSEVMLLDGQAREDFLQNLESQSPELASEVKSLVVASEEAEKESFLGQPATPPDPEETIEFEKQADVATYDTISPTSQKPVNEPPSDLAKLVGEEYEIKEQIGKGGMGIVYRAYQRSLRRDVALKIIPDRLLRSPEDVARFQIEAESAAKLDHPGIVPVYEVGERFGVHYYSMALIEGDSLASYVGLRATRLDQRRAAEIIEQVSHAVQYAHDRAVIHRDIKPENILLTKEGKPRLTDFGLAKILKEDEGLTMTGQVMGTPRYMAPEQATGNLSAISNRTDVYSLGSTLYSLLAGRPPFGAETILQTIKQVAENAPPPLAKFAPHVAPDLQIICEKCLEKRPVDRYASAGDLADDLRRYLDGYPIAAHPLGRWTRGYLWCHRNPIIAALVSVTATITVVAAIVSTIFWLQARQQLARADQNLQKLDQAIEELYIFASENVLANEPGMQAVRKTLLESAQRYYQDLLDTGQISVEKIAKSAFLLGQVQASLGDNQVAAASFETATSNYLKIINSHETNTEAIAALAQTYNEHARVWEKTWYADQIEQSEQESLVALLQWKKLAKECVDWRTKAVDASPDNQESRRLLANALMNYGLAMTEQGRVDEDVQTFPEANQMLQEAQALRASLPEDMTGRDKVERDITLGYISLADLRDTEAILLESKETANKLWNESLSLRIRAAETLKNLPPHFVNADSDWLLATCYQVCGESYYRLGALPEAIEEYRQMQAVMQRLLLQNPRVQRYRTGLARSQYMLSQLTLAAGDAQGYAIFEECQNTLVEAIAIDPRNQAVINQLVDFTTFFAVELAEQGLGVADQELVDRALNLLERAEQLLSDLQVRGEGKAAIDSAIEKLRKAIESLVKMA